MTTIRDIARLAGVAVSTASLALNGDERVRPETRERIMAVAEELEYRPSHSARSLSSGRTWNLQLLNPAGHSGATSSFFGEFVRGVHSGADRHGYTLGLNLPENEEAALRLLDRLIGERRADGIILMNLSAGERLLEKLLESEFPHVLLGHSDRDSIMSVDSDNAAVARDAVTYLISSGRKNILFLNAPAEHAFAQERTAGYREAHGGRPITDELVVYGMTDAALARRATQERLSDGTVFDAVLASSDHVAIGAMRAIRDAGLAVPGNVAVMGINNDEIAEYTEPRLTSVELNPAGLGAEAARLLLQGIAGGESVRTLVQHRLVKRESA